MFSVVGTTSSFSRASLAVISTLSWDTWTSGVGWNPLLSSSLETATSWTPSLPKDHPFLETRSSARVLQETLLELSLNCVVVGSRSDSLTTHPGCKSSPCKKSSLPCSAATTSFVCSVVRLDSAGSSDESTTTSASQSALSPFSFPLDTGEESSGSTVISLLSSRFSIILLWDLFSLLPELMFSFAFALALFLFFFLFPAILNDCYRFVSGAIIVRWCWLKLVIPWTKVQWWGSRN